MVIFAVQIIVEVKNLKEPKDPPVYGELVQRILWMNVVRFMINVVDFQKRVEQTATKKFYLV